MVVAAKHLEHQVQVAQVAQVRIILRYFSTLALPFLMAVQAAVEAEAEVTQAHQQLLQMEQTVGYLAVVAAVAAAQAQAETAAVALKVQSLSRILSVVQQRRQQAASS